MQRTWTCLSWNIWKVTDEHSNKIKTGRMFLWKTLIFLSSDVMFVETLYRSKIRIRMLLKRAKLSSCSFPSPTFPVPITQFVQQAEHIEDPKRTLNFPIFFFYVYVRCICIDSFCFWLLKKSFLHVITNRVKNGRWHIIRI